MERDTMDDFLGQDPLGREAYLPADLDRMLARIVRFDREMSTSTTARRRRFQLRSRLPVTVAIAASLAGASLAGGVAVAARRGGSGAHVVYVSRDGRMLTSTSSSRPAMQLRASGRPAGEGRELGRTGVVLIDGPPPIAKPSLRVVSGGPCSMDSSWASKGGALLAFEEQNPSTNDGPNGTTVQTPFAYESQPIDVAGQGVYPAMFGPVTVPFKWGSDPFGVGLLTPPDFPGSAVIWGTPQVVTYEGQQYISVAVNVTTASTCSGLTLWAY